MTERLDLSAFVRPLDDGGARIDFAVEGVNDAGAIRAIETALWKLSGLTKARVNFTERRLLVEWTGSDFDPASVVERLVGLGYRAFPFAPRGRGRMTPKSRRRDGCCVASRLPPSRR